MKRVIVTAVCDRSPSVDHEYFFPRRHTAPAYWRRIKIPRIRVVTRAWLRFSDRYSHRYSAPRVFKASLSLGSHPCRHVSFIMSDGFRLILWEWNVVSLIRPVIAANIAKISTYDVTARLGGTRNFCSTRESRAGVEGEGEFLWGVQVANSIPIERGSRREFMRIFKSFVAIRRIRKGAICREALVK